MKITLIGSDQGNEFCAAFGKELAKFHDVNIIQVSELIGRSLMSYPIKDGKRNHIAFMKSEKMSIKWLETHGYIRKNKDGISENILYIPESDLIIISQKDYMFENDTETVVAYYPHEAYMGRSVYDPDILLLPFLNQIDQYQIYYPTEYCQSLHREYFPPSFTPRIPMDLVKTKDVVWIDQDDVKWIEDHANKNSVSWMSFGPMLQFRNRLSELPIESFYGDIALEKYLKILRLSKYLIIRNVEGVFFSRRVVEALDYDCIPLIYAPCDAAIHHLHDIGFIDGYSCYLWKDFDDLNNLITQKKDYEFVLKNGKETIKEFTYNERAQQIYRMYKEVTQNGTLEQVNYSEYAEILQEDD